MMNTPTCPHCGNKMSVEEFTDEIGLEPTRGYYVFHACREETTGRNAHCLAFEFYGPIRKTQAGAIRAAVRVLGQKGKK